MEEDKLIKFLKELIPYVIIIVVVVLFRTFIATPVRVDGTSMVPTLYPKEIMILNKIGSIKRFDIIVIRYNDERLIKRVIALPGETIKIEEGIIYVNDETLEENFGDGITSDYPLKKLGNDEYFVLGDNREDSLDSRIIGAIKKDKIQGKANFVLYPLKKFGKVK